MKYSTRTVYGFFFTTILVLFPFFSQAKTLDTAPAAIVETDDTSSEVMGEHIEHFDSKVVVHSDSTITVTETILYDFGDQEKHGIYRDIPMVKVAGAIAPAIMSAVLVTDEAGRPYTINSLDYSGGSMSVKIGDADRTISGLHTYVISYNVRRAIGYFDSYDELYWNVTGNGWTVPIRQVTATIVVPALLEAEKLHVYSYCGYYGDNGTCGKITTGTKDSTTSVTFDSDIFAEGGYFSSNQGMTVAVGFPKGIVAVEALNWWEKDATYYAIAIGIFALFLISFLIWFLSYYLPEHRKRKQPIIAAYEPPQGMTPSVAGHIYNMFGLSTSKMATADILYLAAEGYITIEGVDDTGVLGGQYSGEKTKKALLGIGLLLVVGIFMTWWILLVGAVVAVFHYKETASKIKAFLHPMHFKISRTSKKLENPHHLVALYNLVSNEGSVVDLDTLKNESHYSDFDSYTIDVKNASTIAENEGIDSPKKRSKTMLFARAIFFSFIVLFVIVGGGMISTFFSAFAQSAIPSIIVIDIIVLIVSAIIFGLIRARLKTELDHMTPIWYAVAGLREYIKVAEKERIKFQSNPADSARIFSTLLPFATAFGLEDKWAGVFNGIVTAPPDWYHSTSGSAFSAGMFAGSIHSFSGTLGAASNSGRPSSSGGGGGGGSSGGGGGGGGGGSW